mmetsp:Transcript_17092/g.14972  ORF Transcript_17092/g.14972 Transcript_17092/m.14972 type:complete len:104 (-) Transcript_17092:1056-1367(-)
MINKGSKFFPSDTKSSFSDAIKSPGLSNASSKGEDGTPKSRKGGAIQHHARRKNRKIEINTGKKSTNPSDPKSKGSSGGPVINKNLEMIRSQSNHSRRSSVSI